MKFLYLSCQICVALLFLNTLPVQSSELYPTQKYLTGDWGGHRTKLQEAGVHVGFTYTAEPAASVSGGYELDNTYLHNINAELKMDLDKLIGIPHLFPGKIFKQKATLIR